MSAAEQHQLASEKSPTVSNDLSQLSDEAIQATLSEYKQAQTEYAHLRYGELG